MTSEPARVACPAREGALTDAEITEIVDFHYEIANSGTCHCGHDYPCIRLRLARALRAERASLAELESLYDDRLRDLHRAEMSLTSARALLDLIERERAAKGAGDA